MIMFTFIYVYVDVSMQLDATSITLNIKYSNEIFDGVYNPKQMIVTAL